MRKTLAVMAVLATMVVWGSTMGAQEPAPGLRPINQEPSSPTSPKKVQNVPLELQVVISRYQGEKRISSLPWDVLSLSRSPTRFAPG